jgi:hypothetical protein
MSDQIRVHVRLPREAVDAITRTAERNIETRTQAICDAVRMFDFLDARVADGRKVFVEDAEGRLRQIIFGGWPD